MEYIYKMALKKGKHYLEAYEYLEKIRAAAPRVHCITNYVTAHDVALSLIHI